MYGRSVPGFGNPTQGDGSGTKQGVLPVHLAIRSTRGESRVLADQYSLLQFDVRPQRLHGNDFLARRIPRTGVLRKSAGRAETAWPAQHRHAFHDAATGRAAAAGDRHIHDDSKRYIFRDEAKILAGSCGPHTLLAVSKGDPAHSVRRFGQCVFDCLVSGHVVRIFRSVSGSNP